MFDQLECARLGGVEIGDGVEGGFAAADAVRVADDEGDLVEQGAEGVASLAVTVRLDEALRLACGPLSAEIQAIPPSSRRASRLTSVVMPPVDDEDDRLEAEAATQLRHLRAKRLVVVHAAREDLDRDWPPLRAADEPVDNLERAAATVTRVAELGERARAALEVGGRAPRPGSTGKAGGCQASFEPGSSTRCTIIASASDRSREGARSSRRDKPSFRAASSTARTCPCGSEHSVANSSPAGTSASPASARRCASIAAAGSFDTLATVSWRTRLPSRTLRRTSQ